MFTIPNFLTLLRLAVVPVFLILFFSDVTALHLVATMLFLAASITDWLDGFLARWLQQESEFGEFADPLADKLLSISLFVSLIMRGDLAEQVPVAVTCILIMGLAELGILVMSAISLYRGLALSFSFAGKLKTSVQFVTILLALFRLNVMENLQISPAWLHRMMGWDGILPFISFGFLLSTLLTLITFSIYILRYPRHRHELRAARARAREQARERRRRRQETRHKRQFRVWRGRKEDPA